MGIERIITAKYGDDINRIKREKMDFGSSLWVKNQFLKI